MTYRIVYPALIVLTACFVWFTGYAVGQHTPRFEKIYSQDLGYENPWRSLEVIEVYHDKDTGQEFACFQTYRGVSCHLTGRTWK